MSVDGINSCSHPEEWLCIDIREGIEVCQLCAKVLSIDGLAGAANFNRVDCQSDDRHLLMDLGHSAMVHISVIREAQNVMRDLRREKAPELSSFTNLEIAAYSLYVGGLREHVDYTIKEVAAIAKVAQAKIFRLIKLCRHEHAPADPINMVERIVYNNNLLSHLKFEDIKAIKKRISNFDRETVQSLVPQTIVGAAIFLHLNHSWGKRLSQNVCNKRLALTPPSLPDVAAACSVNKKSLSSLLATLAGRVGAGGEGL